LSGWLAQRFGAVRLFVAAMLGFGICSALCGLPRPGFSCCFASCRESAVAHDAALADPAARIFPPRQQSAALGLWAMTTVVAR